MKIITENWQKLKIYERISLVIGEICSILVILFACLQLFSIWNIAINVCEVLLGIVMITQSILQWKKNRAVAIFSLCVALFVFMIAFIISFFR